MEVVVSSDIHLAHQYVMGIFSYDSVDKDTLRNAIRLTSDKPKAAILMANGTVLLVDRSVKTVLSKMPADWSGMASE